MNWQIPYFDLVLGEEEKNAVIQVLESNWLTTGPKIAEFENLFSEKMANPLVKSLAVANCTVALHLALLALNIQKGDEVICPSLTFVASANAIRYTGASPVFIDIVSERDWNLDHDVMESLITPKTKAIMVVHYAGYPCNMDSILAVAKKHNLYIVEDASHAPLSEWQGQKLGTIGDIGCFSFFSNKNLTTGEGGMIISSNPKLFEKIKTMRSHGMTSTSYDRFKGHAFGYDVTLLGYNYRMDEIRAAIGIEQLKKLENYNNIRKRLVAYYTKISSLELPEIIIPFDNREGSFSYHLFPVLLPDWKTKREDLMQKLAGNGIQTSIHYRPIHSFTAYRDYKVTLPKLDKIAARLLSLPLYPTLKESQIDYIVSTIKKCLT